MRPTERLLGANNQPLAFISEALRRLLQAHQHEHTTTGRPRCAEATEGEEMRGAGALPAGGQGGAGERPTRPHQIQDLSTTQPHSCAGPTLTADRAQQDTTSHSRGRVTANRGSRCQFSPRLGIMFVCCSEALFLLAIS